MYSEADYLFYYFVYQQELHIIPLQIAREWFKKNMNGFEEKRTSIPVGDGHYNTVGRVVPRKILQENVKGVNIISLKENYGT